MQFGELIYYLRDNVVIMDTATWSFTTIAPLPNLLKRGGMCSLLEIKGQVGIMTSYGYWLDLDTLLWKELTPPPVRTVADYFNSMYTFRGLPTMFGQPVTAQ